MIAVPFIQTNHGVSYPVVGVSRVHQNELLGDDDEVPPLRGGEKIRQLVRLRVRPSANWPVQVRQV
ncbi:hypothetical protein [Roseimaritima sediminicola]|uniref:hypothetical protein n=1 Tax=Roseimaritima sediminicola TaxID=2662066 RepID=UPI0012983FAD|nr:hypothetical protein [Roseimaritima sediminicola]